DNWKGMPVNFFKTYTSTVTYQDAFPNGDGPADLVPLLNIEIWGAPISAPFFDPTNAGFVYQRFQRGIMHYSDACHCTQGLLLADFFKSILTGENLPPDLEGQASGSPFYRQYDPSKKSWIAKPKQLDLSDLTNAFARDDGSAAVAAPPRSKPAKETSCAESSG